MLYKTAEKITNILLSHKVITDEQLDVYIYGFELLISFLFSTSLILIAGLIFRVFLRTLAFLAVFIFLRSYTGGFHAKTYLVCTIFTLSTYAIVMLLASYIEINLIAYGILFASGLILLYIFSPVENPNKPLSDHQKKKHKIIGLSLYIIFCASGAAINAFDPLTGATVYFALIADIVLMFIPILMKGGRKNV